MDVPRKAAFYSTLDELDMNRAWQLAEHWQQTEQTNGQMSRHVLLMLITVLCFSKSDATEGQKAAQVSCEEGW